MSGWGCQSYQGPRTPFAPCTYRKAEGQRGQGPEGELGAASGVPESKSQSVGSTLATWNLGPGSWSTFLPLGPDVFLHGLQVSVFIGTIFVMILCGVKLEYSWLLSVPLGGQGGV